MAVPGSTYRLQVQAAFDLNACADVVDYLAELGAGAVYLSPLLPSARGSEHGYDVVGFDTVDAARGGVDGWTRLLAAARARAMGVVVDIVPNHTGVADPDENPAWRDVLRYGRDSAFAPWFDVDWAAGGDHVVLPDARHDPNYRRFFAVSSLAGLRVEDPAVFEATHVQIGRWLRDDGIDGVRVDHPDGLADPAGYLDRLREFAGPEAWIVVEKILEPGESLPLSWPVAGTTGYDALHEVGQVLLDPVAVPPLDTAYRELAGDDRDFAAHAAAGKRLAATTILRPEVERLARLVPDLPDSVAALTELLVAFPVYRSYLPAVGGGQLAVAVEAARTARPDLAGSIDTLAPRLADAAAELCVRFQQTSGAVMAKGVEDTAYYRYARFVAANEVGGDPARPGAAVADFHATQARRQQDAPDGMTTLSTHDTKRGEDVRARLAVLAEIADEWKALARTLMHAAPMPDRPFAYLLWQTLVGVGLIDRSRVHAYAEKAMREAATSTTWDDPSDSFESTVHAAIDRAYDDPALRAPLTAFIEKITPYGWSNALSQKLIQLTMPGVPDVYQGTEVWEDSLVDPDNRRPVDFAAHRDLLARLDSAGVPPPVDATGAAKLWVVSRALRLRRDRPELFTGYAPLTARGPAAAHVVAFERRGAITVATRLPVGLERAGGWRDTALDIDSPVTDVLTGRQFTGRCALADLLAAYPVALLVRSVGGPR